MKKKNHLFGLVLARARRDQGFVNAHSFYKSRDGRRTLRLSFANYRALERGLSLPKPWRLEMILTALDLPEASSIRRELVKSYLSCLLGSDALLRGLIPSDTLSVSFGEEAARAAMRQRATQLDLAQWKVLARNTTGYYCHVYLINTPGYRESHEISRALSLPAGEVRNALKVLAAARIIELSGTRARSPFAYKYLQTLPLLPTTIHLKTPILKAREAFTAGRGRLVKRKNVTTRISAAKLDAYFQRLGETVEVSGLFGDAEKAEDTAGYFIDARVFKIFD